MRRCASLAVIGLAVIAWAGCEFQNLTEAENQLGRGPARSLAFEIPIAVDTFDTRELFDSLLDFRTVTLSDSLLAAAIDTVTLSVSNLIGFSISNVVFQDTVSPPPVWEQVSASDFDLGSFEDAIRDATLNSALAVTAVTNTADAPITLLDFVLGVVPIVGGKLDSVGGQPAYETGPGGAPILVAMEDTPGGRTFALGRMQVRKTTTLQAAALVDRLVDRVLAGDSVALVASGDVIIGDGSAISIAPSSELRFEIEPLIGFDLTLPASGVSVQPDSNLFSGGLDLDSALADDLIGEVLDSAGVKLIIENGLPFAMDVSIALVSGTVTGNVFTAPNAVIDSINVGAALVGANGRVTQALRDTVRVVVTANDTRQAVATDVTVGVRIVLRPPPGGRAAVESQNRVILNVRGLVWATIGGGTP